MLIYGKLESLPKEEKLAKAEGGNLKMPASFVKKLAKLRKEIGAKSDAEVIRRALRIYEKLVKDEPSSRP